MLPPGVKAAIGCAFFEKDLLYKFNLRSLHFSCYQSEEWSGQANRDRFLAQIFRYSLKCIIDDIIENNVTFIIPTISKTKIVMKMQRILGDNLKQVRQKGLLKNLDILATNFTGFKLSVFIRFARFEKVIPMQVNTRYVDRIIEKANNGFLYGDGKVDTTLKDYFPKLYERFPEVPKLDIRKAIKYMWFTLGRFLKSGCDVCSRGSGFFCYFGAFYLDPYRDFQRYIDKLTKKLGVFYKKKNKPWDGYYYFALNESLYENYLRLKNRRGRPTKFFKYGTVMLYQYYDVCWLCNHGKKYIFRVPYLLPIKFRMFMPEYNTDRAELYKVLPTRKFKDILITEHDYDIL